MKKIWPRSDVAGAENTVVSTQSRFSLLWILHLGRPVLPTEFGQFGATDTGELREAHLHRLPKDGAFPREVLMCQNIPHANDLVPWNFGML